MVCSSSPRGDNGLSIELAEGLRLDVKKHLIDRGLGVLGMRGSGKSYTCGVLAEELARIGQPFVIIDLMGEYYTLRERFPILIASLGEQEYADIRGLRPEHAPELARNIVELGLSVVLDLARATMADVLAFLADFLEAFYEAEEEHRRPYVLIVDEAHRIAPEKGLPKLDVVAKVQKKAAYWFYEVAATGRHHGIGFVIAVRRPAEISKAILTQAEVKIIHKLVDPTDLKRLFEEGLPRELADFVRALEPGEAIVLGLGEPRVVKIKQRLCSHGGGTPLVKPTETPDLLKAIRALARALGLEAGVSEIGLPEKAPVSAEQPPAMPAEEVEVPRPEGPAMELDVRELDYPREIVADYHTRLLAYMAMDELMLTPGRAQRAISFFLPLERLSPELLLALTRGGWRLRSSRAEDREILLAVREAGKQRAGLVVSKTGEGVVLTLVISAPGRDELEEVFAELRELVLSIAPEAEQIA